MCVGNGAVLHTRSVVQKTRGITLTFLPEGTARVTYDQFGRVVAHNPADGSEPITQGVVESLNPTKTSDYRPLRVQVRPTGTAHLCDPAVAAPDARACI